MGFADFSRQFCALAWKNYKLKIRSWSVLLLELLVPTVIILALGSIKLVIKPVVIDEYVPNGINRK